MSEDDPGPAAPQSGNPKPATPSRFAWLAEFRALDRRVWSLAAARLVVTAGFSMVLPLLALHLTTNRREPVAPVTLGLIWTAAGAVGAVAQWVAGEAVDRVGRRVVLLWALLVRAANLAALGWAIHAEAPVPILGGLIILNSALRAFFDPVATALVADLSTPEQRVAAFSLQREGVNVGWALGNASAAITAFVSYGTLFYISAPLTLLAAFSLLGLREPPRPPCRRGLSFRELLAFLSDRRFVGFLVATMAFYVLQVQLYQTLSIYAAQVLHLGRAEVASCYTLNGLLVVIFQLPAVAHIRRLGMSKALFFGCLGYAVSYALVGVASGQVTLLLCVGAITMAEIVTQPAMQAAMTSMAPLDRIGAYSGLFGTAQIAGQSIGPLIGTSTLEVMPPRSAWFLLALFGAGAALGYRKLYSASKSKIALAGRENP